MGIGGRFGQYRYRPSTKCRIRFERPYRVRWCRRGLSRYGARQDQPARYRGQGWKWRTSLECTHGFRSRPYSMKFEQRIVSPLFDAECQQNISGSSNETAVAGCYVKNSVDNDRTGSVDRATISFDSVHSIERPVRIELPEHRSIFCRVSTNAAISGARKNDTADHGQSGGFCSTAE